MARDGLCPACGTFFGSDDWEHCPECGAGLGGRSDQDGDADDNEDGEDEDGEEEDRDDDN